MLFDRICRDNGIKHILTAPRSPTTTGKVERWHKTLRREFLDGKVFDSIDDAQAQLDVWVEHYNHERPHQSHRDGAAVRTVPARRAPRQPAKPIAETATIRTRRCRPVTTRRVEPEGHDRVRDRRLQGRGVAGRADRRGDLRGRARADPPPWGADRDPRPPASLDKQTAGVQRRARKPRTVAAVGVVGVGDPQGRLVRQRVASPGRTTGSGTRIGAARSKSPSSVTPSRSRSASSSSARHPIRHDRTREHGALANPGGRPHRTNAA